MIGTFSSVMGKSRTRTRVALKTAGSYRPEPQRCRGPGRVKLGQCPSGLAASASAAKSRSIAKKSSG
jgi:hypothetical protein